MIGITGRAIAQDLGVDARASGQSHLPFFKNQDPCALHAGRNRLVRGRRASMPWQARRCATSSRSASRRNPASLPEATGCVGAAGDHMIGQTDKVDDVEGKTERIGGARATGLIPRGSRRENRSKSPSRLKVNQLLSCRYL